MYSNFMFLYHFLSYHAKTHTQAHTHTHTDSEEYLIVAFAKGLSHAMKLVTCIPN